MRLRRVVRTAAKWAFTVVAGALLVLGPLSRWYHVGVWAGSRDRSVLTGVDRGSVYVTLARGAIGQGTSVVGGNLIRQREDGIDWWLWWWDWQPGRIGAGGVAAVAVPFWAPLLACGAAAFVMWRRDRLMPWNQPGACKNCGYDRRGLAGGEQAKCPECGVV